MPIADISHCYSITSLACASTDGGKVRPSVLAVLRYICRLLTLEDAVDIPSGLPALIELIRSVGNETASSDKRPVEINGRQPTFSRKPNDEIAMNERQPARGNDQTPIRGAREDRNRVLDLAGVA